MGDSVQLGNVRDFTVQIRDIRDGSIVGTGFIVSKDFLVNRIGVCLQNLGRLGEAIPFHERSIRMGLDKGDWHNASIDNRNLARIQVERGELSAADTAARDALTLSRRATNQVDERNSLAWLGWVAHLRGSLVDADTHFAQAEDLTRQIDRGDRHLSALSGVQYARHLLRTGRAPEASEVTGYNLESCRDRNYTENVSLCHSLLGELAALADRPEEAREKHDEAVRIARSISVRPVLIDVLSVRGRWAARQGATSAALDDLEEALDFAAAGGFTLLEADIHVGFAWAHFKAGNQTLARSEAEYARRMSAQSGYYWGRIDATELLTSLPHLETSPRPS